MMTELFERQGVAIVRVLLQEGIACPGPCAIAPTSHAGGT